jgi:hypothetical protein
MVTAQQRALLPDAVTDDYAVLLKASSYLRLTYEIRLATYMARTGSLVLLISTPSHCRFSPELEAFVTAHRIRVKRGPSQ